MAQVLKPQDIDGIPEVSVEDVKEALGRVRIIDVRKADEYTGELGHIAGAELQTLQTDLEGFLEGGDRSQEIVFVCRSGGRSGKATALSRELGYQFTVNMRGGMLAWNEAGLPIKK